MRETSTSPHPPTLPARAEEKPSSMSFILAFDLVLCGVLLAGISLLAQHLEPDLPRRTFLTGLAGGGFCVFWGALGRRTTRCRAGAMVTLVLVAYVFACQAVQSWGISFEGESRGRLAAALMTVLVVICVGTWIKLAHAGKGTSS
jgi:hypothetical protein